MDLNARPAQEVIKHWEWRTLRFTLFRLAMTICVFLLSIPWPEVPAPAELEDASAIKGQRLVAFYLCGALACVLLLLNSVSFTGEWLFDSKSDEVRKDWKKLAKFERARHLGIALMLIVVHVAHWYFVPPSNARAVSDLNCSCQDQDMMVQFMDIVDRASVCLLSTAVVWIIPNRLALLRLATIRGNLTLLLITALAYTLCFMAVSIAAQKVWTVYCSQAAVGGKCTGEVVVKLIELAAKVRGKNLGMLGPVFGWSMSALNAPVKAFQSLTKQD